MIYLRQSTASQEIPLGYFVDSTDGDTEETALSIANTDIKLWKTGATTLANKNSGGATAISNGVYHATLDATDTDTIGPMVIFCHPTGALTVRLECCVLDEAVYDAMFGTVALATATNITAGTITTTTNLTNLPTIPANWLTAAGTAADFGAEMATAIWTDTTAGDFTVAASIGKSVMNGVGLGTGLTVARCTLTDTLTTYTGNTVQTGDSFARIGAAGAGLTGVTGATLSSAYDFAKGTVAMTESFAANGVAPTPVQAMYAIHQMLMQFAISSTTYTVKKLNNTDTAFIVTLDSATTPTSAVRT